MSIVRPAAVAGTFYELDPVELEKNVASMLSEAGFMVRPPGFRNTPKALIVPHAGFVYSGPVAASAYSLIEGNRERIRRVVLLGPAHRVFIKGLALPDADFFATPLGRVPLDRESMKILESLPQVVVSPEAHQGEHSIEVQLPFLQYLLHDFRLVPLVVGEATPLEVEEVLEKVWDGDETLIIVSSDLSHYLPSAFARQIDRSTARAILSLSPGIVSDAACGSAPINGFLLAARKKGLRSFEADLRNSGDTAGGPGRVVGYGAFAFYEE